MTMQTDIFGHCKAFRAERFDGEYRYPMHMHQYAQIIYVYSGALELQTWEQTERIGAGSFAVIMPYQAHKLDTTELSSLLICVFSEQLIKDFTEENVLVRGEYCTFYPDEEMKNYALKQLEFENRCFSCDFNDKQLLRKAESGIHAVFQEYFAQTKIISRTADSDLLARIITYVYGNPTEDISLIKMAASFGYHPNHVSHCFKSAIGMNYCSFVNCVRAERAKVLLTSTDMTSEQIGTACGFSSKRSFLRSFKAITGMTPMSYRFKATTLKDENNSENEKNIKK